LTSSREPGTAAIAADQRAIVSLEILVERLNEPKVIGASAAGSTGSKASAGGR
jgi:hypothetical protein